MKNNYEDWIKNYLLNHMKSKFNKVFVMPKNSQNKYGMFTEADNQIVLKTFNEDSYEFRQNSLSKGNYESVLQMLNLFEEIIKIPQFKKMIEEHMNNNKVKPASEYKPCECS